MIDFLFSEEAGLLLEVLPQNEQRVAAAFAAAQVSYRIVSYRIVAPLVTYRAAGTWPYCSVFPACTAAGIFLTHNPSQHLSYDD